MKDHRTGYKVITGCGLGMIAVALVKVASDTFLHGDTSTTLLVIAGLLVMGVVVIWELVLP